MTDSVMGSWTYSYDGMNRLTNGTASAGQDMGLLLSWQFDRYGNRWNQTASTAPGYNPPSGDVSAVQPQLTFNGSNGVVTNRIDGWSYDAAGNLLYDQINHYTYDAENRIATLNTAPAYIYDAEGRRVAKTNSSGVATTIYVLGLGGEQVSELNGSGAWVHSNVFAGGGRLLASYEGPAGTDTAGYHYHLTDWLGTKRMQTTAAGNQEETCMSYPFGDGLSCTGGADATEYHFTQKERDTEAGLDYFFARYFTSDLARFMTPDWAGKPTAVPYASFGNPQSLDLYAYGGNNPNSAIDLDGHVTENRVGVPDTPGNYCASGTVCDLPENDYSGGGLNYQDSNAAVDQMIDNIENSAATDPEPQQQSTQQGQQPQASGNAVQKPSVFRAPDFLSGNLNVAITNPWTATLVGVTFALNLDRDGGLYLGVGPTVGKSALVVSGSLTGDWLNQKPMPTASQLNGFLTKSSFNGTAGFWGGVQQTWTPGSGFATGAGIVTPQIGVSYTYSWNIFNFKFHW